MVGSDLRLLSGDQIGDPSRSRARQEGPALGLHWGDGAAGRDQRWQAAVGTLPPALWPHCSLTQI